MAGKAPAAGCEVPLQQATYLSGRVRFGVFEANIRTGELTKHGKRLRLQEQPFQLLAILLEKPGELVTREKLRSRLWPQTTVDFDHGVNKAIGKIRYALGDSAGNPRFIETVARRGYRFLADVAVVGDGQTWSVPDEVGSIHSLAVLPLENLSNDRSQDYFA